MNYIIKSNRKNSIITALIVISMILLLITIFINNNISRLVIYVCGYLTTFLALLIFVDFKLISTPVLFSVYHMAFIGLCPMFRAIRTGEFVNEQYVLILFSYILFAIAYIFFYIKIVNKNSKEEDIISNKKDIKNELINDKTMLILIFGMLIVSTISSCIYLFINKYILFSGSLNDGRITAMQGNGILVYLSYLGIIATCMLFDFVLDKKIKLKPFIIIFLFIFALQLIFGFRSRLITFVIILILMYNKKRGISWIKIITTGVIVIIALGVLGTLRDKASGNEESKFIEEVCIILDNGSTNIQYILNAVPDKIPYQYGYTFLINIIMLKPGPDLDFTLWLKEQLRMQYSGGGLTPTLVGEFYINFGIIGIYIGFIFLGIIAAWLEKKYNTNKNAFYISFLLATFLGSVRGGIANIEINLILFSTVYFICKFIAKKIKIKI